MSTLTSEQAITALEHSSKPTVELLDDAIAILGFSTWGDIHTPGLEHSVTLGSDSVKFREQWILRWIVKKLNQSIDVKHTNTEQSRALLSDLRTWTLLGHLLSSIPKHISKEILLERKFCRILSECLATVNKSEVLKISSDQDVSMSDRSDEDDDRPSKKRKVSRDRSIPKYSKAQPKFLLLASLLNVANYTAASLSAVHNEDLVHRKLTTTNWADSVDDAATFIGRVTSTASLVLSSLTDEIQHQERVVSHVTETLHQWIELWQANAKVALIQPKQDPCVAFTNHALIPVLDFLAGSFAASTKTVSQAFERQVALYSVLPSRSMFLKRFASGWSTWETEPQAETVGPVLQAIRSSLGDAAAVSFGTLESASRTMALMGIASRLVPRSDMSKRKAERSWLEALFLCLSCRSSASSSEDESTHNGAHMSPPAPPTKDISSIPILFSDMHLVALQATGIEPSIHFWRFYIRDALSEVEGGVPLETLIKTVNLNASAFVPAIGESEPSALESLCVALANSLTPEDDSLKAALNNVMAPVIEAFGRTRRLDVFVEFWMTKLMDAFHYRTNVIVETPNHMLWDHPTMIEVFSSMCQRHAPSSLCTDLIETVLGDLAGLPDVVGPTHEQFARITILSSLLGPLGKSPSVQAIFNAQARPVADLIRDVLLRSTDYQGHRWRLWKMLELCVVLFPDAPKFKDFDLSGLAWPFSLFSNIKDSESQAVQPNSRYLEGYQWFSFIISSYENSKDKSEPPVSHILGSLNRLMQLCVQHVTSNKIVPDSWNGVVTTMDSLPSMVSACLARLARSSIAYSSAETVPEGFLTALASLTFSRNEVGVSSCLAVAAEATLTKIISSTNTSLSDVYIGPLLDNVTANTVSPLLYSTVQEGADEHQTQELIKAFCKAMEGIDVESHDTFTDYLSVISNLLQSHPKSAINAMDLTSYIKFLGRSTSGAKLDQLVVSYQFIQQTMQFVFAQPKVKWHSGNHGTGLEEILQLTEEQLTKIDGAGKPQELFNTYTGYLILVVGQIVNDIDQESVPRSVRHAVEAIQKHHGSVVLKQCTLYLKEAPDVIDLWLVFILLDGLIDPQEEKSFNKKLQKCLQNLAQAISSMNTKILEGTISMQEAVLAGKLWHILSKYMEITNTKKLPPFPHPESIKNLGKAESVNNLQIQAQLATSRPTQGSLSLLALVARLSDIGETLQTIDGASETQSEPFLSVAAEIKSLVLNDTSIDDQTIQVLGHIACLQTAAKETSPASLIARLELSKLVLDKHPSIVNQHVIDSTLKSISLLASAASKAVIAIEAEQLKPEHVFDRLCAILSTLLVRYRRRLTGRYHLFLPVIQNLLKCLFYPPSRKHLTTSFSPSKPIYLTSLPHWLNPPTHINTTTLPPSSATKFSRILQQLCDPSASSARHVSKRTSTQNDNLVDEVKSLRREVSQHTQYLLQTYCQVILDGSIAPEVKEKLLPGLYAVMNATDLEVMRGLNTAMDGSQRAIWKDLYSEWKTYGRWNQR